MIGFDFNQILMIWLDLLNWVFDSYVEAEDQVCLNIQAKKFINK